MAVVVIDLTRPISEQYASEWLTSYHYINIHENEQAGAAAHTRSKDATCGPNLLFVGTKCDLAGERKTSYEEGKQFASVHSGIYIETSALWEYNTEILMTLILALSQEF